MDAGKAGRRRRQIPIQRLTAAPPTPSRNATHPLTTPTSPPSSQGAIGFLDKERGLHIETETVMFKLVVGGVTVVIFSVLSS